MFRRSSQGQASVGAYCGHFESAEEEGDAPEEETVSEERSFHSLSCRSKKTITCVFGVPWQFAFTAFTGIANASFTS